MKHRAAQLAAAGVVLLAAVAVTTADGTASTPARPRLEQFGSCDAFLAYVKQAALPLVGPWGLGGSAPPPHAAPTAVPPPPAVPAPTDHSATNVQEVGVDEPDLVKTDGSRLFAVARGKLYAVSLRGSGSRLLGSVPLDEGTAGSLLLDGNRLLVIEPGAPTPVLPHGAAPGFPGAAPHLFPATKLIEVDVSRPAAMRVLETLELEGVYVSARETNGAVRLVVTTRVPRELEFVGPNGSDAQALADATERNRAILASSGAENWLPSYVRTDALTGATTTESLPGCSRVWRPSEFSGFGMLTVLTIDLARGLDPVDADGIFSNGQIVYASTKNLYVATETWPNAAPGVAVVNPAVTTALHKFDISQRASTEYRASGEVAGQLLNQWSLSEHRGLLRVATTEANASESAVTVLEDRDGQLVPIGRVGGLGRGERIFAVRFIGDVGYVVTFRQVDPLYTIDLSEPEHPAVAGELKIRGYSAYLHPIDDELLLGIGQDTFAGARAGTQLSVFDVFDPQSPTRLARRAIEGASSEAEYDHHAFLYWPQTRLVVVPVESTTISFTGAIAFRIGRLGAIDELARIRHPEGIRRLRAITHGGSSPVPIRRSLVARRTLYTVSEIGVRANDLSTLANEAWVSFSEPPTLEPRALVRPRLR